MATWKPIRTVPDSLIGMAILVWVPKNRCVFAVVPYDTRGRKLQWWGAKFKHRASHWRRMPHGPAKARKAR